MMTVREAMQRARQCGVIIRRSEAGSTEWRVTLEDWDRETALRCAYYTDCLEDAVLSGASMRRNQSVTWDNY